jgi:hypothetical protein
MEFQSIIKSQFREIDRGRDAAGGPLGFQFNFEYALSCVQVPEIVPGAIELYDGGLGHLGFPRGILNIDGVFV